MPPTIFGGYSHDSIRTRTATPPASFPRTESALPMGIACGENGARCPGYFDAPDSASFHIENQTDRFAPGIQGRHVAEAVLPGHAGRRSLPVLQMARDGIYLDGVEAHASHDNDLLRRRF